MSYMYGFLGLFQLLYLPGILRRYIRTALRISFRSRLWRTIRRQTLLTVYLCAQISFSIASQAANSTNNIIEKITVTEKDGVYYINASADISASHQYVRQVLTDYIHIYRLNDSIVESRVLPPTDNGKVEVETLVQCCVPMYCKDVTRVEEVNELESGVIQTTIIPEKSDFRSGVATWKIENKGTTTRLTYKAHLEPDFFIPPIIGTRLVISNMREEFSTTFYRIERIATINEAKQWNNDFKFSRLKNTVKTGSCDSLPC